MATFTGRIDDLGGGPVAFFRELYREFPLNEENVLLRIENLRLENLPTTDEEAALAAIRGWKKVFS